MANPTHLSKFLSLILRHQPQTIGLQLDANGWASVEELIQKAAHHGVHFDRATLNHIVATNAKKRFAFNATGDKIRASQGHSINIELGYTAQQPPPILYHGTGEKAVPSILATGIEKRNRQHVHLSPDLETAIKVGQRHGKPFVFEVMAAQMHNDGFSFFLSANGVWLTDHVPAKYLKRKDEQ
jgi:putative RNA 2'-phosphotransferase